MPVVTLPRLLLVSLSLLILGLGGWLLWEWWRGLDVRLADGLVHHVRGPRFELYLGAGLIAWSFLGRFVVLALLPARKSEPAGSEARNAPAESAFVRGADGSALHVESFGAAGAPTLILTHGWGLNSTAWFRARRALADRFRVVTWDLPGLGRSGSPKDGRFTIDRFAADLGEVVRWTGADRVLLVGHSIGGMTTLTLWRDCPADLKARIAGMTLVDTTHRDPLQTMWLWPLWRALRWPVIEPMCWTTIVLWPLAWLANWQGYLSGAAQLGMRLTGFGKDATRGDVDLAARLAATGSPAVQAKGNLAMFRWAATDTVATIDAPVLAICGTSDIVTLPAASETIVRLAPRARLLSVPGAGHMGFLENAPAYNGAIAAFADEVFTPARPTPAAIA